MEQEQENPKSKALSNKFTSKLNYKRVLSDANNKRIINEKKIKSKVAATKTTK